MKHTSLALPLLLGMLSHPDLIGMEASLTQEETPLIQQVQRYHTQITEEIPKLRSLGLYHAKILQNVVSNTQQDTAALQHDADKKYIQLLLTQNELANAQQTGEKLLAVKPPKKQKGHKKNKNLEDLEKNVALEALHSQQYNALKTLGYRYPAYQEALRIVWDKSHTPEAK